MAKPSARLRQRIQDAVDSRLFVPACIVFGIVVRLVWIWFVDADQVSDYLWYYQRAIDLARGAGYAIDGVPTGYWPIGYPGFLGGLFFAFGSSALVGKLANLVLYMGTILLTYQLSKRIFHSEPAARITLLILCFYPNHIAYTSILSSEILFIFLVVLAIFLLDIAGTRIGLLMLSGLFWGLASLTKPQALVLPAIVILIFSVKARDFLMKGIVIYAVVMVTVTPWLIRNYRVMGVASLANTGGINLLDGNNPYANGDHNLTAEVNDLLGDLRMPHLEDPFDGKEVARDARARSLGTDYILHHPSHVLALLPKKLKRLFGSDTEGIYYSLAMMNRPGGANRRAVLVARSFAEIYYFAIIVLFLIMLPPLIRNRTRHELVGLALIIGLTLVYLVFFGNARYHFSMMPWVTIYAGIGASRLLYREFYN